MYGVRVGGTVAADEMWSTGVFGRWGGGDVRRRISKLDVSSLRSDNVPDISKFGLGI